MIALLKKLRHSIEWPRKHQFELLRLTIEQDKRWMGHDDTVRALTERYLDIMPMTGSILKYVALTHSEKSLG